MVAQARRFYKEVATASQDGAHAVLLDGKPVHTPGRAVLLLPSRALAEQVAEEWRCQGETLDHARLHVTRLANTAIDRVQTNPGPVVEQIIAYGGSDLLCYRAVMPKTLTERQAAEWQPLLDWAADRYGIRLAVTQAMNPIAQSPADLDTLRRIVGGYDPFVLTGLADAVGILGSLILGLALLDGRLTGEDAFALSQLDERFQIEQWGEDWEAGKRTERLRLDLLTAERFIRLAAEGTGP